MTEYSRMAKGHYTVSGGVLNTSAPAAKFINLPFKPDAVELYNYTQAATPAEGGVPYLYWDADMGQGGGIFNAYTTLAAATSDNVTTGGISTFSAGQLLQYGATQQIVSISKANPAQVEVTAHGYTSGDVVIMQGLYQSATTGMQQIAGIPFTITVVDANNFTIPWNTNQSNYTALAMSPAGALVKKVLYPYLYAPGCAIISAITTGTTTTIDTTSAHNFVVGQEVAFRIPTDPNSPASWGTIQLNSLPNVNIPGSPMYGYVIAVTDYNTFVVNIDSSSYTAFNSNVPFADFVGLQYPQVCAVGDVNTGGVPISTGSVLYPPPFIRPIGNVTVNSINGPAIQGAYFNNTSQGFVIGAGAGVTLTTAFIGGAAEDVIYWRAYLHDMNVV